MNAVYQHPRELVLALFTSAPGLPMTVLQSSKLSYGSWTVDVNVIGESHAIIFSREGKPVFSEVLACYPVTKHRAYYAYEFAKMDDHGIHIGPYYGHVNFREPDWTVPPAGPESLEVTFPQTENNRGSEVPVTRVQWQYEHERLQWWTLHTYPLKKETIRVYSRSHYDFAYQHGRLS